MILSYFILFIFVYTSQILQAFSICRFDDDNMSYRYILSITYTEMGQLNTYNPIYCNEN